MISTRGAKEERSNKQMYKIDTETEAKRLKATTSSITKLEKRKVYKEQKRKGPIVLSQYLENN